MANKNFIESKSFLNFSCLAIFLLSIFLRSMSDIGTDTGIYLYLAKKISQGGKYYYDFFESNFPLSFYFYYLQYQLAQILHLSPIFLSEIVINILALASIFWSAKILEKTTISNNKAHYNLLLISFFLSFFLRPLALQLNEFGTKTSLLLIALYPYLSFSFVRKNPLTRREEIWRGCLMGIIPCIKPHYLVLILCIELKYFFEKKHSAHLDKFIMLLIGSIYLFLMLKFTPEFFEFIVPMWPKIYAPYNDVTIFIENIFRHFSVRILVFAFIFLIFARQKVDENDRILVLFYIGASILMLLENLGTVDQVVIFYATVTICYLKFTYDFLCLRKATLLENKFILGLLFFVPLFDLEILPTAVFGISGITSIWWLVAIFYPFFLLKKLSKPERQEIFSVRNRAIFILSFFGFFICLALAAKYCGGWAYLAVNLAGLFLALFIFEKKIAVKFSPKFSPFSFFIILAVIASLLYSYILAVSLVVSSGDEKTTPSPISDMIVYYSRQYAAEKTDRIYTITPLSFYQFPLLNYLGKEDDRKFYTASLQADQAIAGSNLMFQINDTDRVLTLSYLFDDMKNQLKNPQLKIIFVNNTPDILEKSQRCLIGTLEYYFMDAEFRKIFLENFHFENHVILTGNYKKSLADNKFDNEKPAETRVLQDFEVYVRN